MSRTAIPIENVYYLLSYAWNSLTEDDQIAVSITSETRLVDLLARVLRGGVSHLLKRGLDRAYSSHNEELAGIRGRLDLSSSLKQGSFLRARAYCSFDELSPDVLHNQLVKTTLRRLATVEGLDRVLAEELRDLYRRMPGIQETDISAASFRRVVLGRNNAFYRFPLNVCELVYRNALVDERSGQTRFRDFTRDDKEMARLFEKFLLRFYKKEQKRYSVHAPRFPWLTTGHPTHVAYLPEMRTDVVLHDRQEIIVIDAKYYGAALTEYMSKATVRSGHLYQLFSYMQHLSALGGGKPVSGMLLYPRTTATLAVRAELFGHPFLAATINLAQSWPEIHRDLIALLTDVASIPAR